MALRWMTKNKGLSNTSKLMLCSNTFQTRVFPQPASLDRQGTPVLHQLARRKQKTGKAGRQHRSAAQARVAMYFVFGIAVEESADYEWGANYSFTKGPI